MSDHDPRLPWSFGQDQFGDNEILDADGCSVACDCTYYNTAPGVEDMEFIVATVNAHAATKETLAAARETLTSYVTRVETMEREAYQAQLVREKLVAALYSAKQSETIVLQKLSVVDPKGRRTEVLRNSLKSIESAMAEAGVT